MKLGYFLKPQELFSELAKKGNADTESESNYNLNIPRYVDTFEEEEPIDLNEVSEKLIAYDNDLEEVNAEIIGFCNELGIVPPFKIEDQK